ncbi:hypothetical protein OHB56_12230 [Streptomyces sp. NBC_01635]|uniref:hypothetical protein n=1 Tax=Streptomyces sp. NBC_01635 TaxID=2975904 RepID=UPI0038661133|nr:hypothetical protein OHB56_12230 [Streptomyces sp. NBC_01635]
MTVAHDAYVRQLIARAKDGTIPPQEVQQIAQAVPECRAGRELYQRLYAVARAGGPAYEPLIATYLIHPEDPEVSALAVQVLTGHWRVGMKYREQILELLGSPEWDTSDDAFMAAVSGAGEILHDGFDAELLRALLKLAEERRGEYNDDLMQCFAVAAIARALGAGHAESTRLPEGVTRAEWSQDLLRAARDRLHEAARQP